MEQTPPISNHPKTYPRRPSITFFEKPNVSYHAQTKIACNNEGSVLVYAAVKKVNNVVHPVAHVTLKCVDSYHDNQGLELELECCKNDRLGANHPNVVGVINRFTTRDGFLCVVLPRVDTSLREYVMSKAPQGIDETCILEVLREVLQGLSFIHSKGYAHGQINADHVYLNIGQGEIKLGFAASICDFQSSFGSSAIYLPDNEWLAQRSDIWLVGVMALELAYGNLKFKEKCILGGLLKRISESKRLPSKERMKKDYYKTRRACFLVPLIQNVRKIDELTDYRGRVFSGDFCNMIAQCLDSDPSKRPRADDLLNSDLFRKLGRQCPLLFSNFQ